MQPDWLEQKENAVLLRVVVQPKASQTQIVGQHGSPPRLKFRVAAPPVDGLANQELIRFLSKTLGIAKHQIQLYRGESSKHKDLIIYGIALATLRAQLTQSF